MRTRTSFLPSTSCKAAGHPCNTAIADPPRCYKPSPLREAEQQPLSSLSPCHLMLHGTAHGGPLIDRAPETPHHQSSRAAPRLGLWSDNTGRPGRGNAGGSWAGPGRAGLSRAERGQSSALHSRRRALDPAAAPRCSRPQLSVPARSSRESSRAPGVHLAGRAGGAL